MGEVRFMISEAAKQVHVESHVLRYWEEELALTIGRTEMGHRYYTEDDIQLFCCIKKLKNEGLLLKDLKPLIPQLKETRKKLIVPTETTNSPAKTETTTLSATCTTDNETLEQQEEEHYRKLDCLIRRQQANRRELAECSSIFGKRKTHYIKSGTFIS